MTEPDDDMARLAAASRVGSAIGGAYFSQVALLEKLHGREAAGGRRALLLNLREAPRTVPELAAMRPVSRQYIQKLMNSLLAECVVEKTPNPAHKRSPLYALTDKGENQLAEMFRREAPVFREIAEAIPLDQAEMLIEMLEDIRNRILRHL